MGLEASHRPNIVQSGKKCKVVSNKVACADKWPIFFAPPDNEDNIFVIDKVVNTTFGNVLQINSDYAIGDDKDGF